VLIETTTKASDRIGTRAFLFLFCALLVSACLHLFFPDRQEHSRSVRLSRLLNYAYNGDSSEYALLVATFPSGFKQHPSRVLRPLYPAIGFVVYQPLRVLKPLLPMDFCRRAEDMMAKNGGERVWKEIDVRDVVLAWAALVIVNFGLYMASLVLILLSLRQLFAPQVALLLTAYPALHRNTIDFLLVPTADPFNLLLPAIFLYTVMVLWKANRPGYITALVMGLGMLGKGIAFVIGNWLYEHLLVRNWRNSWRSALLCVMLFIIPAVVYLAILSLFGVPAYNHETTVYRQFVWMVDYLREGRIAEIPLRWLAGLGTHLYGVAVDWTVPLAMCAFLVFRRDFKIFRLDRDLKRHLIVYVLCSAAFWVMGSILFRRLNVCYYPAVIVLLGALAARKLARPHIYLLFGLLAQVLIFALVNTLF